jgi:hypothetical protein
MQASRASLSQFGRVGPLIRDARGPKSFLRATLCLGGIDRAGQRKQQDRLGGTAPGLVDF